MPHTKATVLLAQFFTTLFMAFLMTGIFAAMPIAFVLSLGVGPQAFFLASRIVSALPASQTVR